MSTFYNDTDGILKERNVTGLSKKIKVTLPVKGGEGIKCAFYNETSRKIEELDGNTTDSTKNIECESSHLTTFTSIYKNATGSLSSKILSAMSIVVFLIILIM